MFFVLMRCFVSTWHNANKCTSASTTRGNSLILVLVLMLAFVLASLVETWLYKTHSVFCLPKKIKRRKINIKER